MHETLQNSSFKTETRPYKGSVIPPCVVFTISMIILSWQIAKGNAMSEWISVSALVALSISGCVIFITIITHFNHEPIKVTVTSHAIRIDDGDEQIIIRLIELLEIQRSQRWMQDEIFLKAVGGREFSLENLRNVDRFLSTIVSNASAFNSNGRAAAFALVTNRAHSKSQELVGRKKNGEAKNSLELTNNFSAFVSTLPLIAILPSILVAITTITLIINFKILPLTPSTIAVPVLIFPSFFMIICYMLFVEKQIVIKGDQIIIETSNERFIIPKSAITNVSSRRSGFSRIIKIKTQNDGTIRLRGYSNPESIEDALRWVTTSGEVRGEAKTM